MLAIIISTGIMIGFIVLLIKRKYMFKLLIPILAITLIAVIISWTVWFTPIIIDIQPNTSVKMDIRLSDGSIVNLDEESIIALAKLLRTIPFRHTVANRPMIFATRTRILTIDGSKLTHRGPIQIYIQNGDSLTGFAMFDGIRLAIDNHDIKKIRRSLDDMGF